MSIAEWRCVAVTIKLGYLLDRLYLFAAVIFFGLMAIYLLVLAASLIGSTEERIVTVDGKFIKSSGFEIKCFFLDIEGNKYLVDKSIWKWTFNASDRYEKIELGKTYRIKTFGRYFWLPIMPNYPNAISIEEV